MDEGLYMNCIREESQPLPDRRIVGGNFYTKNYEEDTPFSTWLHRSDTPAGWWSLSRLHHDALTEPLFPRWLFALCKTEIERANGFRPILVERPIKKVRRPAFSAEEARIKVRKLPLLIGSLIGPHEPWHESSLR